MYIDMQTYIHSTVKNGAALTLFPEVSHVSHIAQPEAEEGMMMTVRSGLKCLELSERLRRVGLLGRTLLASSVWTTGVYSAEFSMIWKVLGMRSKHLLFRLSELEHPTDGIGFGLLHTPRKLMIVETPERFQNRMGDRNGTTYPNLAVQIKYLPGMSISSELHPDFVEWMMGYPIGWTELDHLEMR